MTTTIILEDGRAICESSIGMSGMLLLIAKQIGENSSTLRSWLVDMADRPTSFQDFDLWSISAENRDIFWEACFAAHNLVEERWGGERDWPENAYSFHSLKRMIAFRKSMEAGEPPNALNDFSEVMPFDGYSEDLSDLWNIELEDEILSRIDL